MPLDQTAILAQLDQVVELVGFKQFHRDDESGAVGLSDDELEEWFALITHTLHIFAPPGTSFRRRMQEIVEGDYGAFAFKVSQLASLLRGLRTAYQIGLLRSVQELIHADLFDDFLEMAAYLLGEGYKDPAAVLAGGVLEEHLRKLCQKNGIPIVVSKPKGDEPKKASLMNDDLAKNGTYSTLDQKGVTAWLDLRNNAAHGKFTAYDTRHVEDMIRGIRNFVVRYPA